MPDDVFRWVIAVAVILACVSIVVQAGIVVALYSAIKKMQAKVEPLVDRAGTVVDQVKPMIGQVRPILDNAGKIVETTRGIIEDNRPKVALISADAVDIAHNVRQQVQKVGEFVNDATGRAKDRVAKIDETVDSTVEHVEQVSEAVRSAVMAPVKQAEGLKAGLKAALTSYSQGRRRSQIEHATQDEEMFI